MQELYIITPTASPEHSIDKYSLYKSEQIPERCLEAFRICIPDSLTLEIDSKGNFHISEKLLIRYLDYDVCIKKNGKWQIDNSLRGEHELRHFQYLLEKTGLHMVPKLGYMNAVEFRKWFRDLHPEIFTTDKQRIDYSTKPRGEMTKEMLAAREIEEYILNNEHSMMRF